MVGVDIVDITRIANAKNKEALIEKILTENEKEYLKTKSKKVNNMFSEYDCSLAGFWAAKEAVLKALEVGIVTNLKHIEILHKENGAPFVKLNESFVKKYNVNNNYTLSISISHDGGVAICVCLGTQNP